MAEAAKTINNLDDHSLAKIFNLLGIDEWIELSQMTKRFCRVISEHVIPTQMIQVVGPNVNYSTNELFQMFGKYITKIEFDAEDYVCKGRTRNRAGSVFEVFLQMLLDYCEPGKLKEDEIWDIDENIQNRLIDRDLLTRSADYFKNVTSLKISFECDGNAYSGFAMEQWLASIPDEQIESLTIVFNEADQYDFKLKPNSFPSVRNLKLYFWPGNERNERNLNPVTDFIQRKQYIQSFYCEGLGDEIVKTAAKSFRNIKALGAIDLNSNSKDFRLEELKHLRSIEFWGSSAKYQEFHNIFTIVASQKTLEHMQITLNKSDDSSFYERFSTFFKSDCKREKIYLKELVLDYVDEDEESSDDSDDWYDVNRNINWDEKIYVKYLIINVFNFKTLSLDNNIYTKLLRKAIANVDCLENVVSNEMRLTANEYEKLIFEKVKMTQKLGTSNRLNIYISNAEDLIIQLGSGYDPQLIALEPITKYVEQSYWR